MKEKETTTNIKQFQLNISGHVQGVFFRQSSLKIANQLKLSGWVCNNDNQTVSMCIKGTEINCQKMITWCHQGPPQAKITKVTIKEESPTFTKNTFIIT